MAHCIQLGHCKDVSYGVIVGIYIEGQPIQVFMKLFNYCPFEGKKFQLVHRVMGSSLGQAPTSIGYDCIHDIFIGLVEDSSQARPTSIGVELKRLGEVCISKDRCSSTQPLQVIKCLLAPVIPPKWQPFSCQHSHPRKLIQGFGYLHEFWDKLPIISHESQETLNLCDICQDWPLLDCFYLAFVGCYALGRDYMRQVGNLPWEQLTL